MVKTEHACLSCQIKKRKCVNSGARNTCVRCIEKNIQCVYSRHKKRGRRPKFESSISSILMLNVALQNDYPQMENPSPTIEPQETQESHEPQECSNNLSQKDLEELFPGISTS
ncbi:4673_t:CDS:2 [Diversispora eburnea]|uniref:4673_t:CDS:1 n=1 Tax=Diversispora eburnea TaxID=1213867 RepID=A0A9N8YPN0_9GLOM|nr:4673_t:CDS:2 [Diversispora eburnea]